MSTGDPDLDAVLAESPAAAAPASKAGTGDPDLDAVISEHAKETQTAQETDQFHKQLGRTPTQDELASVRAVNQGNPIGALANIFIGGPLRGVVGGLKGLWDIGAGKGVETAAKDVEATTATPEPTSMGSRAVNAVMKSPANPLNWIDQAGQWSGDKAMKATNSPAIATAARIAPDAAAMLLGFGRGNKSGPSTMAEPEAIVGESNKYAGAVAAERGRLQGIHDRGAAAGLDLPESGTEARFAKASGTNTQVSNSIIRRHFGLPDDPEGAAPLTPEMMDSVRAQVAKETYGPVRATPSVRLSNSATDAIDALPPVIRNKLKFQGRPLSGATPEEISGGDLVNLSQRLRSVAKSYDQAFNRGGHPESGSLADLTHDAVDKLEQSGTDSLRADGKGDVADSWEGGRKTIAQTHDVEAVLDGAGNVNVAALRKRPYLTGDLDMLANLGGRYPEAFKVTRLSKPQVGVARKATAAAVRTIAPIGGAAAGSILGPWGAAGGAGVGRALGERSAEKIAPQ
jgi:hypothetical protein